MSTALEALEAEVVKLARAERSHLLERLIASLDSDPEVEEAWAGKRTDGKPSWTPVPSLLLTKLWPVFGQDFLGDAESSRSGSSCTRSYTDSWDRQRISGSADCLK